MEEKKLVPKRRFGGFEGEWEKDIFSELLNEADGVRRGPFGSALKKDTFVKESDYVVYEQQNAIYDHYAYRYHITKEKYEELIRFKLQEGDFIMSGAGTIGAISRAPKGIELGVINQALIRMKINDSKTDPEYFLQWIRSKNMQKRLKEANPASAMENLIPMSELKEWIINIPSLSEQEKIGKFFKLLDERIANQERKIAKVKAVKSAYLTEMFPQEGETVPRRRFGGFEGEWTKCKLKEFTTLITKGTTPKDKSGKGIINFIKIENIKDGKIYPESKITKKEHETYLKRSKLEEKDILFSIAGTLGRVSIVNQSILPANTNQALAIIRGYHFNSDFLLTTLSGKVISEFIKRNPTIGAQPNLSLEQVGNFNILTPKLKEQQKIGNFFKNLDSQIMTEEAKLEKLKKLKEAYLEEMFV